MPDLHAAAESLPGDDDATVARYPAGTGATPQRAVSEASGVDLENGSSIVVPASKSDSRPDPNAGEVPETDSPAEQNSPVEQRRLRETNLSKQTASSATAYFMKPMPRKRGSSMSSGDPGAATDAATQLWQSLTAENDEGEVVPEAIRLEHFEIHRLIGRGGMGAVFAARDLRLNRTVALKVLAPEHTGSKSSLDRFRNEARAAARLDHENISRVHYLGGQLAGSAAQSFANTALPFIALEFVEGPNVRELIRQKGPLPAGDVLRVGLQLAAALRETSACGVVHRDIKPSNVIITPQGRAKLVDLGLARTDDPETSNELTVAGTTLGTFDYISPEQAKDPRTVDVRSDIYSLGCTLFHMAVGQAPYPEGTMLQKLLDHQGRVAPDARSINHRVPVALSELIKRMMRSDVDERPQSADELYAEISAVASTLGVRAVSRDSVVITRTSDDQYADEGWRRYLGWIVMAAVLGIIAVFADQIAAPPQPLERRSEIDSPSPVNDPVEVGPAVETGDRELELELPMEDSDGEGTKPSVPAKSRPLTTAKATTSVPEDAKPDAIAAIRPTNAAVIQPQTSAATVPSATATEMSPPVVALSPGVPTARDDDGGRLTDGVIKEPFVLLQPGNEIAFATLEEAIQEASDGTTIEIRSGGVVGEVNRKVRIAEKSVEIIAAPELDSRPVIRITEPLTTSPNGVRLFELSSGGLLRFYDVDLEVVIPAKLTSVPWNVFTLSEGCTVELDGARVTVRNVGTSRAALFEVVSNAVDTSSIASLVLDQCLIRGETTLLRADGQCSIEAPISEAAIAIRGPILDLRPNKMPAPTREAKELSIHIDESTLLVADESLFEIEAEQDGRIARVRITSDDSVFVHLDRDQPLVSMRGDLYNDEYQDLFSWDGSKNYFALDTFWTTAALDASAYREPPIQYDFAGWVTHWGEYSQDEQQVIAATVAESVYESGTRPITQFSIGDFAPIDGGASSIRRGTGAKRPGVPWNQLFVPDVVVPINPTR